MDWKQIAPIVGAVAPFAGKVIGGFIPFPGAGLAGELIGKAIGTALGVPPDKLTPQGVSDALGVANEETKRAAINAAVEQARVQINGFVEAERIYAHLEEVGLQQTGETIRAEDAGRVQLALQGIKEHWFFTAARPASLWVFNAVNLCFGMMLVWATGKTAWFSPDPIAVLKDSWPLFAAYFGPLCLVNGVYINARSKEKVATIAADAPMPNAAQQKLLPPPGPLKPIVVSTGSNEGLKIPLPVPKPPVKAGPLPGRQE